jgi:hypothetical protein
MHSVAVQVSDHIFLGATMATCLHAELVCVLVDVVRSLHPEHVSVRELLLTLVWLMALFLYLCTCADMFFTAKVGCRGDSSSCSRAA